MGRMNNVGDNVICSFCGKHQDEVKKLVAGPSVYICDQCIQLCNEIIADASAAEEAKERGLSFPKPPKTKKFLDQYVIEQDRAKKSSP